MPESLVQSQPRARSLDKPHLLNFPYGESSSLGTREFHRKLPESQEKGSCNLSKACMKYIFHGNLGKGFCPKFVLGSSFIPEQGQARGLSSLSQGTHIPFSNFFQPTPQAIEDDIDTLFLKELVLMQESPSQSLASFLVALNLFLQL